MTDPLDDTTIAQPAETRAALKAHIKSDATDRAKRTAVQGLLVDLAVTIGVVGAQAAQAVVEGWDPQTLLDPEAWLLLALTVGKTGLLALVSYIARLNFPPRS